MKLVELLAKHVSEWPKGAEYSVQDGDRRQTVKYGKTKGNLGIKAEGHSLDVWQNKSWGFTSKHDFDHDELASDFLTAIVTQEMWKAERDKQNGGEWKRHRGNKMPIDGGLYIEAKLRCGDTRRGYAQDFIWSHAACDVEVNLMKYRVISQPQAEEVAVKDTTIGTLSYKVEIDTTEATQAIDELAAKWDQVDGPLRWRDTVNELDAYIEEFTREREALINRLALEGFSLLPAMTAVMGVADVDFSDWRNWRAGDIVECITNEYAGTYTEGREYKIEWVKEGVFSVYDNYGEPSSCDWFDHDAEGLKFVRRP